MNPPPRRIETERLVLRAFEPADAAAFGALLERNREHFAEFIPFFLEGDPHERVRTYCDAFAANESFSYLAFAGERLVGGGGLFARIGPDALEVGYHVDGGELGKGYATEITTALVDVAFAVCGAERVEFHIHPHNAASIAIATRAGATETGYDAGDEVIFSLVSSASDVSVRSARASDSASGG